MTGETAAAVAEAPQEAAPPAGRVPAPGTAQNLVKWWKHSQSVSCSANAAASERLTAK